MDKIEKALQDFAQALPESPAWVLLLRHNGELLGITGNLNLAIGTPLTAAELAKKSHTLAKRSMSGFDALNHGNFQYAISTGGDGCLIIVNLIDQYFLAISYIRYGIQSFDDVMEGVILHFEGILNTINPNG